MKEEKIYYTYGAFDILTQETVMQLQEIIKQHPSIMVGIYTDELIKILTPYKKMIFDYNQRREIIECLKGVIGTFPVNSLNLNLIRGNAIRARNHYEETQQSNTIKPYNLGYVSGVFDLVHPGHIEHLRLAAEKCNKLIVGVKTDKYVDQYKHKTPIMPENTRLSIIKQLKFVDDAFLTDQLCEPTSDVIRNFGELDVLFLGSDWTRPEKMNPDKYKQLEELRKKYPHIEFTPRPAEKEKKVSSTAYSRLVREEQQCLYPEKPLELL